MAKYASKARFSKESKPGVLHKKRKNQYKLTKKSLKNQEETDNPGCLIL